MRSEHEVLLSAYHEAAHAVFVHHDNIDVDDVTVSDNGGACRIDRADLYERYLPLKYAQFCLAGAYAASVAQELRHPKPDQIPLSWLIAEAERTPEGDAWWTIEALKRVVKEGDVFDSVGEAYAFAMIKLAGLVEERWDEIEALAFALHERWLESEEGIGRLGGDEMLQIIEHIRGENEYAFDERPRSQERHPLRSTQPRTQERR